MSWSSRRKHFKIFLASLHGASSAWPFNSCPTTGMMAVLGASQKTIGGNNGKAYPCLVLVFLLKCDVIGNVKLKCLAFPAGSKKRALAANALPPWKPSLTSLPMLCGGPKDTATGIFWRNSNPWTGQGLLCCLESSCKHINALDLWQLKNALGISSRNSICLLRLLWLGTARL